MRGSIKIRAIRARNGILAMCLGYHVNRKYIIVWKPLSELERQLDLVHKYILLNFLLHFRNCMFLIPLHRMCQKAVLYHFNLGMDRSIKQIRCIPQRDVDFKYNLIMTLIWLGIYQIKMMIARKLWGLEFQISEVILHQIPKISKLTQYIYYKLLCGP